MIKMHLALYRKWRPKTFSDVIGQEHITTTLQNEIINNKTAHAYLFTGSRGTGKTTCSKILAMAVNCINPQNGNPCMECEICKGIESGAILDVIEMDAASNNGVDDVRILRDEANYTPSQCKYRVYIIDETHMLSTAAFNALLKIMEEPPAHVKFILATTEIHKVPATILSRCQRFDFVRIKTQTIADRLLSITEDEDFTLTEDAAFLIARLADGGMRDALSTLEQCTSFSLDVTEDVVSTATGLVLKDYLFKITDLIVSNQSVEVLNSIGELYNASKDLQKFCGELIEHFRNLMIVKAMPDPKELIRGLPEEMHLLNEQAHKISINFILRAINILQECTDKISKDFDKRLCVEMAIIKLCSPNLDASMDALIQRIEKLEAMLKNGVVSTAVAVPTTVPIQAAEVASEPNVPTTPPPMQKSDNSVLSPPPSASAKSNSNMPSSPPVLFEQWVEVMASIRKLAPAIAGVLAGSMAYTADDFLFIDCPNDMLGGMIKREGFMDTLNNVLFEKTGIKYKIRVKKKKKKVEQEDNNLLDQLTQNAKNLGIETIET